MQKRFERDLARPVPVLVLNFNGWDDTFGMLEVFSEYYENIWLIDNGSKLDRTGEAKLRFPGLRTFRLPENVGWAAGYNMALSVAVDEGFEFAYLLNNDALPYPGAVESVVKRIAVRDDMAAVGSVILDSDSTSVWYDGDYLAPGVQLDVADIHPGIRSTRAFNGAGFIIRLSAFVSVGPFFEEFFLYHEEVDWSVRAMQQGWRICVDGSSMVTHEREGSNSSHNSTYYRVRNRFMALRRGVSVSGEAETLTWLMTDQLRHIARLEGRARTAAQNGLVAGLSRKSGPRGRNLHPALLLLLVTACQLVTYPSRISSRLQAGINKLRSPEFAARGAA